MHEHKKCHKKVKYGNVRSIFVYPTRPTVEDVVVIGAKWTRPLSVSVLFMPLSIYNPPGERLIFEPPFSGGIDPTGGAVATIPCRKSPLGKPSPLGAAPPPCWPSCTSVKSGQDLKVRFSDPEYVLQKMVRGGVGGRGGGRGAEGGGRRGVIT